MKKQNLTPVDKFIEKHLGHIEPEVSKEIEKLLFEKIGAEKTTISCFCGNCLQAGHPDIAAAVFCDLKKMMVSLVEYAEIVKGREA